MSSIQEILQEIMQAVYGRDVRQAIHDGIECCFNKMTSDVETATQAAQDAQTAAEAAEESASSVSGVSAQVSTNTQNIGTLTTQVTENTEDITGLKADLGSYGAIDVLLPNATFTSRTNNGVIFTWSADSSECAVSGTSTGVACTYLYSSQTAMPDGIKAGETYHVDFETSDNHCYLELIAYDSEKNGTSQIITEATDYTVPIGTVGMYIRLRVSNTATVNITVPRPKVLTAFSNRKLETLVNTAQTTANNAQSAALTAQGGVDGLEYKGVMSGAYINSSATLVSPYDNCNTIPNGDIVTYGTNYVPTNAPDGFVGGTIATMSGRNRGYSVGGTFQLCVFKTGKAFVRMRWGSNADAYTDWRELRTGIDADLYTSLATFSKIGVVGDSFSSGSITHPDTTFDRYFDLSWIQVLGREIGADATNYSQGGLSTKTWLTHENGLAKMLNHNPEQLYFLALGINDYNAINNGTYTLGTIADIKQDYTQNPDTFYGNYGRIIEQIKAHAPDAIIVMLSILRPWTTTKTMMNPAIAEIADHYDLPYIFCDDDPFFMSSFYSSNMANNHPVAITYAGMAKAVRRLTERFMVENPSYFREYYGLTGS